MDKPSPKTMYPTYSIVVITSVRQSLYDLLRSLEAVDRIDQSEVILVFQEKDGKLDLPLLESLTLHVVLLKHEWGRPYGFYRNEGIRRARGEFVLFLDDDVVALRPDWLSAITNPIVSGRAEAVMGRVVVEKSNFLGDTIALLGYPAGGNLGFSRMWHVDRNRYTRHLSTCNAAISRSIIIEIGGFDDTGSTGEDNVLACRLVAKGYHILYLDSPVVRHVSRSTLSGFIRWHFSRGKAHYFVRDKLNEGLYALRLKSYSRLMIDEMPFRSILILFLLLVSVVCQASGYFSETLIARRMRHKKSRGKFPSHRDEMIRPGKWDRPRPGIPSRIVGLYSPGPVKNSKDEHTAGRDSPLPCPSIRNDTGGNATGAPVISVIVPVKSTYTNVAPTLNALVGQDISEPFELIVSTEKNSDAARMVAKNHPMVRLVLGRSDRGPGGNRNRGIAAAKGTYLAFIDADVIPEPDWLSRMLGALRRSSGRPVCGWNEAQPGASWIYFAAHMALIGIGEPKRTRLVPGINGGNMGISKSLLDQYNARFAERIYGAEEIVLLTSLPAKNRMAVLDPKIRIKEPRSGGLNVSLRRMFRLGTGSGRLREDHSMRGAIFARHLYLVPLMVPARFFQTVCRLPYCRLRDIVIFALMSPVVLLSLSWYAAGFSKGARSAKRWKSTSS
ncbi:MAG: glycosyltransferase [Deltaproteobacteria bacterium]|nr:glycosyltransferase [Deltaproteobacteria bacterium]